MSERCSDDQLHAIIDPDQDRVGLQHMAMATHASNLPATMPISPSSTLSSSGYRDIVKGCQRARQDDTAPPCDAR
jgi:hypothetical protein